VHGEFVAKLKTRTAELRFGDPTDEATDMAPRATRPRSRGAWRTSRTRARNGAEITQFGEQDGVFYPPTILTHELLGSARALRWRQEERFGRELSQWFFDTFTEPKLLNFDLNDGPKGDRRVMRPTDDPASLAPETP